MNRILLAFAVFMLGACSSPNPKFSDSVGQGDETIKMHYQKPANVELNLPKTAIISCDSQCKNAMTQVYEFEHVDSNADNSSCKYKFSVPCYPYGCDSRKYSCAISCSTNDQCAARAICDQVTHQCVPAFNASELAESRAAQRAQEKAREKEKEKEKEAPKSIAPAIPVANPVPTATPEATDEAAMIPKPAPADAPSAAELESTPVPTPDTEAAEAKPAPKPVKAKKKKN